MKKWRKSSLLHFCSGRMIADEKRVSSRRKGYDGEKTIPNDVQEVAKWDTEASTGRGSTSFIAPRHSAAVAGRLHTVFLPPRSARWGASYLLIELLSTTMGSCAGNDGTFGIRPRIKGNHMPRACCVEASIARSEAWGSHSRRVCVSCTQRLGEVEHMN